MRLMYCDWIDSCIPYVISFYQIVLTTWYIYAHNIYVLYIIVNSFICFLWIPWQTFSLLYWFLFYSTCLFFVFYCAQPIGCCGVYVSGYVHAHECAFFLWAHVRLEQKVECLVCHSPPYCLKTGSLSYQEAHQFG